MDKGIPNPNEKDTNETENSDIHIEPKFLVTPVPVSSDDSIQEQASVTEVDSEFDPFSRPTDSELDPVPGSSTDTSKLPLTREELIKSFVIDVSDTSDSDSETSEVTGRATHFSLAPGRGHLDVIAETQRKNHNFSGLRGIRAKHSRRSTRYERAGLRGLVNIGNTCFMNSTLQCLSNTAPLLRYILNDKFVSDMNPESPLNGGLLGAFIKLVKELWHSNVDIHCGRSVDTTALKCQLQVFAPRFRGFSQQDSQELLRYLLDALHCELNRVQKKPKYVPFEVDESWNLAAHSLNAWKSYIRVDSSKIVDIFVGQLKSTLSCCECGNTSVTFDPFWDLSISIPPPKLGVSEITLEDCLHSFTKEEVLDGNEKAYCSKCMIHQKSTKCFMIERFPEVLVIHLKRFNDEGKLRTVVRFPLNGLDIGQFSSSKTKCCSYNLYGISNHFGNTSSGHYIAYCKHPFNNSWSRYDDNTVQSVSNQIIRDTEGYVLFFEMSEGSKSVLF